MQTMSADPVLQRDTTYFRNKIGSITSARDLVADRRLLTVALGAFGLADDINSKAFVERILTDGTAGPEALANRLTDKRYRAISDAFGFGPFAIPQTARSGFADDIIARFERQNFETAVGDVDEAMRLALNAEREIEEIARADTSADAKWFTLMGSPPLRKVMETALGLPGSFGKLDIDRQLTVFREKSDKILGAGEVADLASADGIKKLVQRFLTMTQIADDGAMSPMQISLTLLQH
ncbi:DUF1217 domain-containing protein [Shimia biformata]|uniref:DUF1217 domain-containing protein n=1 Tax=Shimia biformata TaxID=1294299 RepID=UPI0019513F65|nr:DUF1217 domain-containing protein [Shimia biformata]